MGATLIWAEKEGQPILRLSGQGGLLSVAVAAFPRWPPRDTPMTDARIQREQAFHDARARHETRESAFKFYRTVARTSSAYLRDLVLRECAGRRVLEFGCGAGSYELDLARAGAIVVGIDISPEAIERARERVAAQGLSERISFQVMNAEELTFSAASFDRVCGSSILHHLDLDRALRETARILKPGGDAVFYEPLGHNPLINLYRRLTPRMRSEDEHPLKARDLDMLGAHFGRVEIRYFHLLSIASVVWKGRPGFDRLRGFLESLDRRLFTLPFFRRQAWIVVIKLSTPRV
jgi:SAM-dependent methyltransferase